MKMHVEFRGIDKTFDRQSVLRDINFSAAEGEFVVLLGPSGCGKSTLLRLTAGLEEMDAGEILLAGRVINDILPADRDISMVFQSYALYPVMSVRDNLAFNQKIRKVPPPEIEKRVQKIAEMLRLQDLLDRRPAQLSGGQRQRVAMGRAMMREPALFLFDEPLSNLDARLRAHMRGEIKALQRQLGTTAIYVTHDQIEAMTMADKIVVMQSGCIAQIGTPADIYNCPRNVEVARFVGSPEINILEGHVEHASGRAFCRIGGTLLPFAPDRMPPPGLVLLGVRPHDITLCDAGTDESVDCEVRLVEPTGGFDIAHVRADGDKDVTVQTAAGVARASGERCGMKIDMQKAHLFSAQTCERI